MGINVKFMDFAINQKWNGYKKVEFDNITLNFIKKFIEEYYTKVKKGLIDDGLTKEGKKDLLKELLEILDDVTNCQLYVHIKNWLDSIDDEKLMLVLINDIFKLDFCCQ